MSDFLQHSEQLTQMGLGSFTTVAVAVLGAAAFGGAIAFSFSAAGKIWGVEDKDED